MAHCHLGAALETTCLDLIHLAQLSNPAPTTDSLTFPVLDIEFRTSCMWGNTLPLSYSPGLNPSSLKGGDMLVSFVMLWPNTWEIWLKGIGLIWSHSSKGFNPQSSGSVSGPRVKQNTITMGTHSPQEARQNAHTCKLSSFSFSSPSRPTGLRGDATHVQSRPSPLGNAFRKHLHWLP